MPSEYTKMAYCDDLGGPPNGISLCIEGEAVSMLRDLSADPDRDVIREVDISFTPIDRIDFAQLIALPNLESVRLYQCGLVEMGRALRLLPPVKFVSIDCCNGSLDLRNLSPQNSTLQVLCLYKTTTITMRGIEDFHKLSRLKIVVERINDGVALGRLKWLKDLDLHIGTDIMDLAWLSNMDELCRLLLEGKVRNSLALASLRSLRFASIRFTNISVLQGLRLAALLPKCRFDSPENHALWFQSLLLVFWLFGPLIRFWGRLR